MAVRLFFFAPRVLSLLFVAFLALFSLDVFTEYEGAAVLVPLLIHLLPALVLLVLTLIAWRYAVVGAVLYLGAAVGYVAMVGLDKPWSWYAALSGPAALVGILYVVSWWMSRTQKTSNEVELPPVTGGENAT